MVILWAKSPGHFLRKGCRSTGCAVASGLRDHWLAMVAVGIVGLGKVLEHPPMVLLQLRGTEPKAGRDPGLPGESGCAFDTRGGLRYHRSQLFALVR